MDENQKESIKDVKEVLGECHKSQQVGGQRKTGADTNRQED